MPILFPLGTTLINATQAASTGTLATPTSTQYGSVGVNVQVYNAGPNTAFFKIGGLGVTATVPTSAGTGSTPVPIGFFGFLVARSADTDTFVSAICKAGESAELYFTVGNGS